MKAMPRFAIYSDSSLVGWSELEHGDPPMSVAFGRFLQAPAYIAIQPIVVAAATGPLPEELRLSVRDANGSVVEATGGVHIVDCSPELGPDAIEVSILGVLYPKCEELFSEHVATYKSQFKHAG